MECLMKNMMKTYKTFYPFVVRLLIPVAIILAVLLQRVLRNIYGAVNLCFLAATFLIPDFLFDFYIFNGITSRQTNYGILKLSPSGRVLLRRGVLLDQLRRLAGIVVLGVLVTALSFSYVEPEAVTIYLWYAAMSVALIYTAETLFLNGLRYLGSLIPYSLASYVLTLALELLLLFICQNNDTYGARGLCLLTVLFALLGVAVTWGTVKHVLYRYDHSFYN